MTDFEISDETEEYISGLLGRATEHADSLRPDVVPPDAIQSRVWVALSSQQDQVDVYTDTGVSLFTAPKVTAKEWGLPIPERHFDATIQFTETERDLLAMYLKSEISDNTFDVTDLLVRVREAMFGAKI